MMKKREQLKKAFFEAYERTLSSWPTKYKSYFVNTTFGATHIIETGNPEGNPLLLIPGAGDTATMWYGNVESLGKDYRLLALDIVGEWGKSDVDRPPQTREELANWIHQVIAALGIDKPHIAGLSFGGYIATNFAVHYPDYLDKLVLIAPAATFDQFTFGFFLRAILSVYFPSAKRAKSFMEWMTQRRAQSDEFYEQGIITFQLGPAKIKLYPIKLAPKELRSIKSKTLLLMGKHERVTKPKIMIKNAKNYVENLTVEVLEDCCHLLPTESPDLVNKAILSFLK